MSYNFDPIAEDCERLFSIVEDRIQVLKQKKILVTGANGLLGGFLSDFFCYLNDRHNFGIELSMTSLSQPESADRISHLLERKEVTYTPWDFSQEVKQGLFEGNDYVFFLSGYGQPKKFINQKMKTIMLNTHGLDSLLRASSKKKCSFVFASSSEVYGEPDSHNLPTNERYAGNYSVESNRACYISSKRLGEVICLEHARDNENLRVSIARIALSYGPGAFRNDDRVLQDFLLRGKEKGVIQLFDEGRAIRNYIYITDCMKVLLDIAIDGKQTIYNVGGDTEEVSILELAKTVGQVINVDVKTGNESQKHVSKSPSRVSLDMSRYNKEFGRVSSPVKLKDGVKQTAKWFKLID